MSVARGRQVAVDHAITAGGSRFDTARRVSDRSCQAAGRLGVVLL
jgi:hypothetical protein